MRLKRAGEKPRGTEPLALRPLLMSLLVVLALPVIHVRTTGDEGGSGPDATRGSESTRREAAFPLARHAAGAPAPAPTYRGKTAAQWAETLGDKDYWVRWHATYALGRMRSDAVPAVAALERILANLEEHEYVRGGAAWALGRIGPQAATAGPVLVRALASKHVSVRRNAAKALGCIASLNASIREGAPGRVAPRLAPGDISELARLLGDQEPTVRVAAAQALWRIERRPAALHALEAMLNDPNSPSIAFDAATALGELAAEGAPVAPALAPALGHADDDVRRAAAQAIGQAGSAAVPLLRDTVATADHRAKIQAVEALGWIGSPAVPALTEALGHADAVVRRHAARALGRLGPDARAAEPDLVRAVSDSDARVRDAAAEALRRIRGD